MVCYHFFQILGADLGCRRSRFVKVVKLSHYTFLFVLIVVGLLSLVEALLLYLLRPVAGDDVGI